MPTTYASPWMYHAESAWAPAGGVTFLQNRTPEVLQLETIELGLPLQLYTPFFADTFPTKHRTFESTFFAGTKLPVPDDSYAFFADLFDLGLAMTGGRFHVYEIDFLDDNFRGCVACFADVTAARKWYKGMADAALERNAFERQKALDAAAAAAAAAVEE